MEKHEADTVLGDFEKHLQDRGRSEATVKRYLQIFKDFMNFTGKASDLTEGDVERFLASKRSGTYKRFLYYTLKNIFNFLGEEWTFNRKDLPSKSEPKRPYFNLEETEKILNAVDKHGSPRDRALIHVAAVTGARRAELRNLNREEYRDGQIYIKNGKTLDPATKEALEEYLKLRKDDYPAMFTGRRGRLSLTELSRRLKRYLELAELNKSRAGYNSFRRGVVTKLHKKGLSEKEIQEYGGWRSPFMVQQYISLEPKGGDAEAT